MIMKENKQKTITRLVKKSIFEGFRFLEGG